MIRIDTKSIIIIQGRLYNDNEYFIGICYLHKKKQIFFMSV